ncbi:MAG: hypothetical protein ABIV39_07835, partial [Verrucomicrobiota bacterium]
MKKTLNPILFTLFTAATLIFPNATRAVPYASRLSESGGNVAFSLNETADNVKVVFANPASTMDLGALARGIYTFPRGTSTSYQ